MKINTKSLYFELIKEKAYDLETTEARFVKLNLKGTELERFQLKSAIVYLSRFEEEIDRLIEEANTDAVVILNAATVKQERS